MKENKNILIYSVVSCFVLALILLIDYKSETNSLTESQGVKKSKESTKKYPHKFEDKKISRKIASLPPISKKVSTKDSQDEIKRKIVGSGNKDIKAVNIINNDWKSLAYKKLNFTWGNKAGREIDIEEIKPVIYVKHGVAKNVEHVKIKLTDEKGKRSNYEAYIDSETGSILHTWNRTRYEYKKKFYFNATGKEFNSNPLKYENSKQ